MDKRGVPVLAPENYKLFADFITLHFNFCWACAA
jgi:hypothetical protein